MNKKIIITVAVITVVLVLILVGPYLLRGSLIVSIHPAPADVNIDNTELKNVTDLTMNLLIGTHNVTVKKDFYNDFHVTSTVGLWGAKKVNAVLTFSEDGEALMTASDKITNAWIQYTKDKDSVKFLKSMKPLLSDDSYDSLTMTTGQVNKTSATGITTRVPTVSGPVSSTTLARTGDSNVTSTVTVKKQPKSELSVSSLVIDFIKTNGSWVADNITYNY